MSRRFCVVGAGASGCYAAEALCRGDPDVRVDVLERLEMPYGLIRYGVAPDHQGTKAVTRTLERILTNERIRYFGGICVGRDITLEDLCAGYSGVVLATGVNRDRRLHIPGEGLRGVLGSGALAGWYNAHPQAEPPIPPLQEVQNVVVIGNGNVALDVARVLGKNVSAFHGSDLSTPVTTALGASRVKRITIVGRRSAQHARFGGHELRQIAQLHPDCDLRIGTQGVTRLPSEPYEWPAPLMSVSPELLMAPSSAQRLICLEFQLTPVRIEEDPNRPGYVGGISFERTRDEWDQAAGVAQTVRMNAQLVVTCVGYDFHDRFGIGTHNGALINEEGRVREGLYVVGWAKRGPSGTIGTNRADSISVAAIALRECGAGQHKAGFDLEQKLRERGRSWITFAQWKAIDRIEIESAAVGRTREKLTDRRVIEKVAGIQAGSGA